MAKILVVEDEPYIALGLKSDLALEGYQVEVARDGDTAFERARKEPFDLILLDVMLPGKDGFAVCRELRHHGVRTPIIMLTAKTQEAEKVLGLELGADDYVTKPFSPIELRARCKAVLRRVSGEAPEVYRFGDIEVDFTRAEVRREGTVVATSALEFKLLTTFIRRRGRAPEPRAAARRGLGPGRRPDGPRHRQPHHEPPEEDRAAPWSPPVPGERARPWLPV